MAQIPYMNWMGNQPSGSAYDVYQYYLGGGGPGGTPTGGGITSTNVSVPYMGYPSYAAWLAAQGGRDGGGGGITNPNPYDPNQNLGINEDISDYEADAYGVGQTFKGTLAQLKARFKSWKDKKAKAREEKKEKDLMDEIREHNKEGLGSIVEANIATYGSGDRPNTGLNEPGTGKGQSPTGGDVAGTPFAQGGRTDWVEGGMIKDLTKDPEYRGWKKMYESNPEVGSMHDKHPTFIKFYKQHERDKKKFGGLAGLLYG